MDKVIVLSLIGFTPEQLDKLRAVSPQLEIHQIQGAAFDDIPADIRNSINVMYGWGSLLDEAHRFPHLKWIQTHSAGVNNLLDTPIWKSDIILTNVSGIHPVPMAEQTLTMMLAFRWKLLDMIRWKQQAEWPHDRWDKIIMPELRGSTLGLVGYGAIARELARLAHAMGMRVLAVNRSGQRTKDDGYIVPGTGDSEAAIPEKIYPVSQLLDVLPLCDYVVLLTPLTPHNRHLFNAQAFGHMKPTAFFFNLGRGPVVDEAALVDALQQGKIAGAGLDVFEQEPLPPDSPLWQFQNVIIFPHVGGFTPHYDERACDLFAENLRRYVVGEPLLNLVKRERGY